MDAAAFPQFTEDIAPDARVNFHLAVAGKLLPADRWGDLLDEGTGLYTAHRLTLELLAMKARDGTGGADAAAGPVTGETRIVGGVSHAVTRAGATGQGTALADAGQYNATVYGQQFLQLVNIVGAGGMVA